MKKQKVIELVKIAQTLAAVHTHTHTHTHTHVVLKDILVQKRNIHRKNKIKKEVNVDEKTTFIRDVKQTRSLKKKFLVYLAFFVLERKEVMENAYI